MKEKKTVEMSQPHILSIIFLHTYLGSTLTLKYITMIVENLQLPGKP